MPSRSPIRHTPITRLDTEQINNAMNDLARQVQEINQHVGRLLGGPSITGDIDMKGFRIRNLATAEKRGDATTRGELQERALYENENHVHVAGSKLIANEGVRSNRKAREKYDLVTLEQLNDAVQIGGNAVLVDGDQSVNGTKSLEGLALQSNFTVLVPSAIGFLLRLGRSNNIAATTRSFHRCIGTGDFAIGGIIPGALFSSAQIPGFMCVLFNESTFTMTLQHESADIIPGRAATRIQVPNSTSINIRAHGAALLMYSASIDRWFVVGYNP